MAGEEIVNSVTLLNTLITVKSLFVATLQIVAAPLAVTLSLHMIEGKFKDLLNGTKYMWVWL